MVLPNSLGLCTPKSSPFESPFSSVSVASLDSANSVSYSVPDLSSCVVQISDVSKSDNILLEACFSGWQGAFLSLMWSCVRKVDGSVADLSLSVETVDAGVCFSDFNMPESID